MSHFYQVNSILPYIDERVLNNDFLNRLKIFIAKDFEQDNDEYHPFAKIIGQIIENMCDYDFTIPPTQNDIDTLENQNKLKIIENCFEKMKNSFEKYFEMFPLNEYWGNLKDEKDNIYLFICAIYCSFYSDTIGQCIVEVETTTREHLMEEIQDLLCDFTLCE